MSLSTVSIRSFLLSSGICVLLSLLPAGAQTIVQDDFEDGTTQGWAPFGSDTVSNSTDVSHSGSHSLKTTNRTATYMGPGLDVTSNLVAGATYQFSVWVRLVAGGSPATLNMTVKRTPTGGSAQFDSVASTATGAVTDAAWVQIQGQYSFGGSVSDLLVYIQSDSATGSFYIDDFVITQIAGPPTGPQDNSGITTTFEDGKTDGWYPRIGDETLTVTTADAHTGNYSLLVTGRQHAYDGAAINVANKMYNGSQYQITVWVKLAPGQTSTTLRVSLQVTLGGNTNYYTVVPGATVTNSAWVELTATYNMAYNYDSASLYVESASGTQSFYIDDFQLTYIPPVQIQTNIPSIYQTLASYFPIGAAIDTADLSGVHAQLLTMHFNGITSGNDMKWDATEPTEGSFNFTKADAEVAFAQANHMRIRGHNLVWYSQIPSWVFLDANGNPMTPTPENKALLLQRMQNHINAVVTHFGNAVYAWDVVNEPIDQSQPDGLRHTTWYQIIGPEYIADAFRFAHAANPNAELFVNDYDTTNPARRAALYNLVSTLLNEGVPINAVGHEMHDNIQYPSAQSFIDTVNMFSQLGIDQQVTELDMSVYTDSTSKYTTVPDSVLAEQGYRYRDYFEAFRQLKGQISEVTFWGMADDDTWLDTFPITRLDMPLPFDTSLQAKPAYWGIIDPSQLPGSALAGDIASKSGPQNARVWTIAMNNPGPGTAFATQIDGFTLTQTSGAACTPVVTPPSSYPIVLGDVTSGGSATAAFTIDFTGCPSLARFAVNMPFSSTGGANTGSLTRNNEFR
ncbi:MAG: endo-1,4-beta-xylanase [Acidobacteriaceae bacterium]|nr:endo-1,4-beta-xylanase [Acidobacteriaceae bacterium]